MASIAIFQMILSQPARAEWIEMLFFVLLQKMLHRLNPQGLSGLKYHHLNTAPEFHLVSTRKG